MRFFFLILLLAGVFLGVLYPRLAMPPSPRDIGSWPVFDTETGFQPVDVPIAPAGSPVFVFVELTVASRFQPSPSETVLTITGSSGGRTVLAETMSFADIDPVAASPQGSSWTYRSEAGAIDPAGGGLHTFVVGPGDAEEVNIVGVDLVLSIGEGDLDSRIQPIGFVLMTLGAVGFVLSIVRRRRIGKPGDENSGRRWGRDA